MQELTKNIAARRDLLTSSQDLSIQNIPKIGNKTPKVTKK